MWRVRVCVCGVSYAIVCGCVVVCVAVVCGDVGGVGVVGVGVDIGVVGDVG